MPRQQRARTPKTSQGKHGGGGKCRTLTEVQKVNLGGGLFKNVKPRWAKPVQS